MQCACNFPAPHESIVQRRVVFCHHLFWWCSHLQPEPWRAPPTPQNCHGETSVSRIETEALKCKLTQTAVSNLGYDIGADGIWPDEGKLNALSKWLEPSNTTEVRSFVGCCSCYRRFVKDFAGIAKPLHELTEKRQRFYWNKNCQRSFEDLKNRLIGAQFLSHPNYDQHFVLDTDTSNNSIAVVLSNLDNNTVNPLAFASRVLTRTEVN